MHPSKALNFSEGYTYDQQKAEVQTWLQGGNDGRIHYAPDHTDTTKSQIATARQFGLPICYCEWSPRYDTPLECHISAAAYDVIHDWMLARAQARELAWDAVFASQTLVENDNVSGGPCPGWAAGARQYKALWGGDVGGYP
jgi:hypothetical protein